MESKIVNIDTIISITAMLVAFLVYLSNKKKANADTTFNKLELMSEERDKLRQELNNSIESLHKKLEECVKEAKEDRDDLEERMSTKIYHLIEMLDVPIALVEETGIIEGCSYKFSSRFGYMVDELRNQPISILVPDEYKAKHILGFQNMDDDVLFRTHYRRRTVKSLHKDGTIKDVVIYLSRRPTKEGFLYVVTLH